MILALENVSARTTLLHFKVEHSSWNFVCPLFHFNKIVKQFFLFLERIRVIKYHCTYRYHDTYIWFFWLFAKQSRHLFCTGYCLLFLKCVQIILGFWYLGEPILPFSNFIGRIASRYIQKINVLQPLLWLLSLLALTAFTSF